MRNDPGDLIVTHDDPHIDSSKKKNSSSSSKRAKSAPSNEANHASELSHWDGVAPENWKRQRTENISAKRRFRKLAKAGELPDILDVMLRDRFVEKVSSGQLYPYPVTQRKRQQSQLPAAAKWKLRDRHVRALGLVVTAHLSCKTEGLVITHAEMAHPDLLDCSERTAGTTMRELAAWGLIVTEPWFDKVEPGSLRQASWYRVSTFAVQYFDIRPRRARARKLAAKIANQEHQAQRPDPEKEVSPTSGDVIGPAAPPALDSPSVKARPDNPPEAPDGGARANPPTQRRRLDIELLAQREVRIQTEAIRAERAALEQARRALAHEKRRLAEREDGIARREARDLRHQHQGSAAPAATPEGDELYALEVDRRRREGIAIPDEKTLRFELRMQQRRAAREGLS
jgi:hypothetical protein